VSPPNLCFLGSDQDVGEDWADFDLCALVGDPKTEVLLVDAHVFHDVVSPGVDLCYRMEVRCCSQVSIPEFVDSIVRPHMVISKCFRQQSQSTRAFGAGVSLLPYKSQPPREE